MIVGSHAEVTGAPKLDFDSGSVIAPVPRVAVQAFCETAETAATINAAISDRRMEKAHVTVAMGGASAAVESYRSSPTPNVIVLEANGEREALTASLDELAEFCDSGTKVVVCGRVNDIVLYRALIARGVSEYLVAPFGVLDFVRSISSLYSAPGASPVGRSIAVVGAKGGVGASTICHNLAWTLARNLGAATVILDLDLPFGTAGLDFNQDPPQGIADAVFAPDRLDNNFIDRLLSKCTPTLSLLAAPAVLENPFDFAENAFDGIIDVVRATTPWVVLDVPHLWCAWTKRLLVGADELVIVATPDLANLRNAKNLIDAFRAARPNDAPPKLVLNFVGVPKRPEIAVADFAKAVEIEPSIVLSFDPKLFGTATNNGQMIAELDAGSKPAEMLAELAQTIAGRAEIRKVKKTLWQPLMARLGRK